MFLCKKHLSMKEGFFLVLPADNISKILCMVIMMLYEKDVFKFLVCYGTILNLVEAYLPRTAETHGVKEPLNTK